MANSKQPGVLGMNKTPFSEESILRILMELKEFTFIFTLSLILPTMMTYIGLSHNAMQEFCVNGQ